MKLAFHRIIRVGNISYLMLGVVQYIIFSTIPTLGQTVEPYGLGLNTLQVGYLQLPQALVFVALGPIAGMMAIKHGSLKYIVPGSIILAVGIVALLAFHSTSAEVALLLILFAVGGAFVTLSANVIIYFTPPDSTAVVAATYQYYEDHRWCNWTGYRRTLLGVVYVRSNKFRRRDLVCAQCVCV